MTPQNIVTNLELSKKLKESGFPQDGSVFYWICNPDTDKYVLVYQPNVDIKAWRGFAAPTASEIGEKLPAKIINPSTRNLDNLYFNFAHKGNDSKQDVRTGYTVEYHTPFSYPLIRITSDTEANARAKMWLYLKKHNLLKGGREG
jgi:hypothetical protein